METATTATATYGIRTHTPGKSLHNLLNLHSLQFFKCYASISDYYSNEGPMADPLRLGALPWRKAISVQGQTVVFRSADRLGTMEKAASQRTSRCRFTASQFRRLCWWCAATRMRETLVARLAADSVSYLLLKKINR